MRFLFGLLVPFFLVSCATPVTQRPTANIAEIEREKAIQREMAVEQRAKEEEHVMRIAFPVLKESAPLCKETRLSTGAYYMSAHSFTSEYQDAARQALNVGDEITLWSVFKGSPLAKAGLKKGDRIVGVNDHKIPGGSRAYRELAEIMSDTNDANVDIDYMRGDTLHHATVKRVPVCDYNVVYEPNKSEVNAYADGGNIFVTRGMERFIENDNEMALVIAHELAHNTMQHIDKQATNSMIAGAGGLVLDILAGLGGVNTGGHFTNMAAGYGGQAYSQSFESEADYVGMYYMARAGFNTQNVGNFWRRMASENDARAITHASSHPTSPERFLAISKTHQEIMNKKKKGLPVEPNLEVEKVADEPSDAGSGKLND